MNLETLPDVARTRGLAGQVLLYPGHVPPGLFVVLSGALSRLEGGNGTSRAVGPLLDASTGPFVVPAARELLGPAAHGLAVVRDAVILFVPRSLVLAGGPVAAELEAAPLALVSLK